MIRIQNCIQFVDTFLWEYYEKIKKKKQKIQKLDKYSFKRPKASQFLNNWKFNMNICFSTKILAC